MSKCKCYHTQNKLRYTYNPITGSPIPHDVEVGVCWGTKECDECRCEGDESKCDFYPEVRAKADKVQDMSDEEKQIQEMANITRVWCEIDNSCGSCHWETCNECLAECLYKAGYRKVRHGEWKISSDGYYPYCNNCRTEPKNGVLSKFCPECGAKMDGESEDNK